MFGSLISIVIPLGLTGIWVFLFVKMVLTLASKEVRIRSREGVFTIMRIVLLLAVANFFVGSFFLNSKLDRSPVAKETVEGHYYLKQSWFGPNIEVSRGFYYFGSCYRIVSEVTIWGSAISLGFLKPSHGQKATDRWFGRVCQLCQQENLDAFYDMIEMVDYSNTDCPPTLEQRKVLHDAIQERASFWISDTRLDDKKTGSIEPNDLDNLETIVSPNDCTSNIDCLPPLKANASPEVLCDQKQEWRAWARLHKDRFKSIESEETLVASLNAGEGIGVPVCG